MAGPDPFIGQVVDRYRIEEQIGRGGMGVVYRARHEELGVLAAVKTISPEALYDESARSRFVREGNALARSVEAQGVVRIHNVGQLAEGTPYILMEYVDGPNLSQRLKDAPHGRLELDAALLITEQLARTLAELHGKGVIHRDIKPDNIKLVRDAASVGGERVKLLDLGIAKLLEDHSATSTRVPGTPIYMAPESCKGLPADGKSDVYSLGCVLYEMLCGRPPFLPGDDNGDLRGKHIYQTPRPPHQHVPDLPKSISAFVQELLEKAPADRPTAQEVADRAAALRSNPAQPSRRRLWRRLRTRWLGMRFAYRWGMPIVLLVILTLLGADRIWHIIPRPRQLPSGSPTSSQAPMALIPGGRFVQGSSAAELKIALEMARTYDHTHPEAQRGYVEDYETNHYLDREAVTRVVELRPFRMDQYEVTNEQFAQFLQAELRAQRITVQGVCPKTSNPEAPVKSQGCVYDQTGTPFKNLYDDRRYGTVTFAEGRFMVAPADRERPVVAVSFLAALAFCSAAGKRLPTEAEWEYTARRGGRRFPFGDRLPSCSNAVLERRIDGLFSSCRPKDGILVLPAVGSMPTDQTIDGIYDMGGSVAEWTADVFVETLPPSAIPVLSPRQDPPPLAKPPVYRVLRGGAWDQGFLSARGAARFKALQILMHAGVGFRCVSDAN